MGYDHSYESNEKCYKGICHLVSCGYYSCLDPCRPIIDSHLNMEGLVNDLHWYKTDHAQDDLKNRFYRIRSSLREHCYNIDDWLRDSCSDLYDCEDALSQIKSKIRRVNSHIDDLNYYIKNVDRENYKEIEKLKIEQQKKIKELNDLFNSEKNKYQNFDEADKESDVKNKELEKLTKEKDKLQDDINRIDVSEYIKEEKEKAETEFQNQKNKIDENYKVTEEKLEKYTSEDLQIRQKYLEDIKRIKDFSGKIPNYNNWIWTMGLSRYLN